MKRLVVAAILLGSCVRHMTWELAQDKLGPGATCIGTASGKAECVSGDKYYVCIRYWGDGCGPSDRVDCAEVSTAKGL